MDNLAYQEAARDELLNGEIVLTSPRPTVNHNRVSGNIYRLFANYLDGKACEAFADGTDVYLSENDRVIPDVMVVCDPDKVKRDGIHGAPDLIVEVLSPGTEKRDRGHKKDLYECSGVREYWVVEPETQTVEVYLLKDKKYVLDEVYRIYPDYVLDKMPPEERAEQKASVRCSLFTNLDIPLRMIFRNIFLNL